MAEEGPNTNPVSPEYEPVRLAGLVIAAVTAVLQVLFVFHAIPLDPDPNTATVQTAALNGAVVAIVTLVAVLWAREKVTPTAKL